MPDGIPAAQPEMRGAPEVAMPVAGYAHELSDGTTVVAASAKDAIELCPVLRLMPPEHANALLELSAVRVETVPHHEAEQPVESLPEEQVDRITEKTVTAATEHSRPIPPSTESDKDTLVARQLEYAANHTLVENFLITPTDHAPVQAEATRVVVAAQHDAEVLRLTPPSPNPAQRELVRGGEEPVSSMIPEQPITPNEPTDFSASELETQKTVEPDTNENGVIVSVDDSTPGEVVVEATHAVTAVEAPSLTVVGEPAGNEMEEHGADEVTIELYERVEESDAIVEALSREDTEDSAQYDDELWALFAELRAVAVASVDYVVDKVEAGQSEQSEGQDVSSSFEQFVAAASDSGEVRTFDQLQTKADDQPLEQTLVDLGMLLSEQADDSDVLTHVVEIVRDIVENFPDLDEEGLLPTDLEAHITPEITHKLVELLRSVGYSEPREVLLELISERGLQFLIEGVKYLYRIDKGEIMPERSKPHLVLTALTGTNKHHSLGRVILRLLHKHHGQPRLGVEAHAISGLTLAA